MAVPHDIPLISTIAVGLSLAFICGLIASKLRIPPIVGYILAGIIIGPHTPGYMADIAIAEQLSEIGVVLLLFGVGLHFSVQDFMQVRKIAFFGATLQILAVTGFCVFVGYLWEWSLAKSVLFGIALSVASTIVLIRALEENQLMNTLAGKIGIGWLIVEDVVMVLAIVLIPTFAPSVDGTTSGSILYNIGDAFLKVFIFAVIMFVVGRRALPWLLTIVSRTGSRELFTLAVFSMAMGIAYAGAVMFGISFALGAFFAGMMIRESDLNHEVADRALPFQDAFAVLFFVAVGMLFNPMIILEQPDRVLATLFIIVAFKGLVTYAIMALFRYPLKTRVKVAAAVAQIGEFSFILIALGSSLGMISDEGRNLILAGALLSIAINPLVFTTVRRWADKYAVDEISETDALAHLEDEEQKSLKDLVILVGAGKVGKQFITQLDSAHVDLVIIDQIRERVETLRQQGLHAIAGDASNTDTLDEALIERAFSVVIAVPDPFEARRIIEVVQKYKPHVKIIVRSHNDDETSFFESQNVDVTVTGHVEVARRMVQALDEMKIPKHV
jgi:CPA2 family monovalent cation:H+ antiporter-2